MLAESVALDATGTALVIALTLGLMLKVRVAVTGIEFHGRYDVQLKGKHW